MVGEILVRFDARDHAYSSQAGSLRTAGSKTPSDDYFAAGGHNFAVEVASAGENAGGANFDIIAFNCSVFRARCEGDGGGAGNQNGCYDRKSLHFRYLRTKRKFLALIGRMIPLLPLGILTR